jgi:hypothetical protein
LNGLSLAFTPELLFELPCRLNAANSGFDE